MSVCVCGGVGRRVFGHVQESGGGLARLTWRGLNRKEQEKVWPRGGRITGALESERFGLFLRTSLCFRSRRVQTEPGLFPLGVHVRRR